MAQVLGKSVGPIGFGLMGFTWRPEPPPLDQAIDALKAAVQSGCTFWNGGEFYGRPKYNSMTLLKHYFTEYPEDAEKVTVVIKGGMNPDTHASDGSPEATRRSLDNIISQLCGKKKLDLFAPARRDPNVPLEVTLGVIQEEYIDTGKLGGFSLSECRAETIYEASKYIKVSSIEVELSLLTPDILTNGVAAACAELGIPIAAYSPIGRGILTGRFRDVSSVQDRGIISTFPRFQHGAFEHNLTLVNQVEALAQKKGCTPAQLAIGWVKSLSDTPGLPTIIPIPGATTRARVEENGKLVELSEDDVQELGRIVCSFKVAGE